MPTKLKLRYYGDPVLRKVAKPVKDVGAVERFLIKEMIHAMYEFDGSGLAATQVGIEEQIFVADIGEGPFAVVNPEILKKSRVDSVVEEGCLSLPGIRVNISRPETLAVRYKNEFGQTIEREISGLFARVFQHEADHLCGRMLIDHASKADKEKFKEQLAALEALSQRHAARSKGHV